MTKNNEVLMRQPYVQWLGSVLVVLALVIGGTTPVVAGNTDPLFVNLTSEGTHRAAMALAFGKAQLERGHPLTVFLNDKGVVIAAKTQTAKYAEQQKTLAELMKAGAMVIACPMCMKHYGVQETDLLPGIKIGQPDLTGGQLFKDNTKTLTW